jgi:hypothetical protein
VIQTDPTFGFVILNSGNTSGVVSGATLDVKRGGEVVGQLKVTNVEQKFAVADVVEGSVAPGSEIRPGDTVTVSRLSSASAWRDNQRRAETAPAPTAPKPAGQTPAPAAEVPPPADPFAVDPVPPPPPADPPAAPPAPAEGGAPAPETPPAAPPADPFVN